MSSKYLALAARQNKTPPASATGVLGLVLRFVLPTLLYLGG